MSDESQEVRLARMEERQISMDRNMVDKFDSLRETIQNYHENVDARIGGLATKVSTQGTQIGDHETRIVRTEGDRKWAFAIASVLITAIIALAAAYVGRDKQVVIESAQAAGKTPSLESAIH